METKKYKPSCYNIILHEQGKHIAFNSANCALAQVNEDFLDILENPNQPLSGEKSKLFENMIATGFLIDSSTDELDLLRLRYLNGCFDCDTLTVTILPTDACNFSCFYCFEHKLANTMSKVTQQKSVELIKNQLKGAQKLKICWFGGEPLLAEEIIWSMSEDLLKLANEKRCEYSAYMVTNGYMINDEIIENLKRYKINTLQITIDGDETEHNKRKYDKTGNGTFRKIIDNIKKLALENFKVVCRVNIDRNNADSIKGLLLKLKEELADKRKNVQISFGQILPIARLDEWDTSVCLSDEEYSLYVDKYIEYMINCGFSVPDIYPFYPTPNANFCAGVQKNAFVIRPTGVIDKCWDCDTMHVGDVHEGIGQNKEYENNLAKWLTRNPFEDDECKKCRVLPICMGGCPYFAIVHKKKKCLKWKSDIENAIKKKCYRHLCNAGDL